MLRLVVAASLLVLVAGCSSDPEPKEPQEPTKSASPTIAAPTMPAQAKENSPEGAAAFVSHYVKAINFASNTGDIDALSQISSPDCAGCQSYIKLYREIYANGGYFKGSDLSLGKLDVTFGDDEAIVFGTVTSQAGTVAKDRETDPKPGIPEDADLTFIIKRSDSHWELDTLELQANS